MPLVEVRASNSIMVSVIVENALDRGNLIVLLVNASALKIVETSIIEAAMQENLVNSQLSALDTRFVLLVVSSVHKSSKMSSVFVSNNESLIEGAL